MQGNASIDDEAGVDIMYAMTSELSKLGMKLKVYAILTLVFTTMNFLEGFLLPASIGVSGFIAIPLLVFQILIIVGAKKSAKAHNNSTLSTFGTLMLVSLILSFGSVGVIVLMSMQEAMDYVLSGGTGAIDLLSINITEQVISLATIALELVAWVFMFKFFNGLQELDVRARGKPGAILALVASCISIASVCIVGFPLALLNPTIDLHGYMEVSFPLMISGNVFSTATAVVTVIGYFIMSQAFVQLGNLWQPGTGAMSPGGSEAVSWRGVGPVGGLPDPTYDPVRGPVERPLPPAGAANCPSCGAPLGSLDPRAMFCGECGARLPGRG